MWFKLKRPYKVFSSLMSPCHLRMQLQSAGASRSVNKTVAMLPTSAVPQWTRTSSGSFDVEQVLFPTRHEGFVRPGNRRSRIWSYTGCFSSHPDRPHYVLSLGRSTGGFRATPVYVGSVRASVIVAAPSMSALLFCFHDIAIVSST